MAILQRNVSKLCRDTGKVRNLLIGALRHADADNIRETDDLINIISYGRARLPLSLL